MNAAATTSDSAQQQEHCQQNPRFGFGLIADVQWADAEDGSNFAKTSIRHYRGAFAQLVKAVDWWKEINESCETIESSNSRGGEEHDEKKETESDGLASFDALSSLHKTQSPLSFVAQLGDLIDGMNASLGTSRESLAKALDQLDRLGPTVCPSINLVGNHELYNFDRTQLQNERWLRHGNAEYYSFLACRGFRIVVLDAYQLSLIGFGDDQKNDPRRLAAVQLLAKENSNISPDGAPGSNWFDGIPEGSYQRRFVPFNGGYGTEQLDWLESELESARSNKERVIVLSHVVMHPKACGGSSGGPSFMWDYDKALEILNSCRNEDGSRVVLAVLCGHDHGGGYYYDDGCDDCKDNNSETEKSTRSGIHHITVASPLNKGADGSAYGIVRVFDDKMDIVGPNLDDLLPPDRFGFVNIKRGPFMGDLGGYGKRKSSTDDCPLESISFSFKKQNSFQTTKHLKATSKCTVGLMIASFCFILMRIYNNRVSAVLKSRQMTGSHHELKTQ